MSFECKLGSPPASWEQLKTQLVDAEFALNSAIEQCIDIIPEELSAQYGNHVSKARGLTPRIQALLDDNLIKSQIETEDSLEKSRWLMAYFQQIQSLRAYLKKKEQELAIISSDPEDMYEPKAPFMHRIRLLNYHNTKKAKVANLLLKQIPQFEKAQTKIKTIDFSQIPQRSFQLFSELHELTRQLEEDGEQRQRQLIYYQEVLRLLERENVELRAKIMKN